MIYGQHDSFDLSAKMLVPTHPPPTHTQLHLSNASELKGEKKNVLIFFHCPIGDYANAVVTFVVQVRKVPFFFFFMAFLETCCVLCNH